MSNPMQTKPKTLLLRLRTQGLEIDIESGESSVVDLVVRAQQRHSTAIGRFGQYIAHTLRRAANACDPCDDQRPLRATEVMVGGQIPQYPLTKLGHVNIVERLCSGRANGETHYNALALYEGVKHRQDDLLARFVPLGGWGESGNDLHKVDLNTFQGKTVIVEPDPAQVQP